MKSLIDTLESDAPVALVTQGGGMRGTYGIAALIPLAERGYADRFSDVYGTSAGAMNGAYYLAGQSEVGLGIYLNHLPGPRFISFKRPRRIIDIDYLVDEVLMKKVPLNISAVAAAKARLHVGLTDSKSGTLHWIDDRRDRSLLEALRATAALPIVFGREVPVDGGTFVDGGLNAPIPLLRAISDGYEDILVVLTRPRSYRAPAPARHTTGLLRALARLQGHSRGVVRRIGSQGVEANRVYDILRGDVPAGVRVWTISPSGPIAGRLTKDRALLEETARIGKQDGELALSELPMVRG